MVTARRLRPVFFALASIALALMTSGCLITPKSSPINPDDQLSFDFPLLYEGCSRQSGARVTIEARPGFINDLTVVVGTLTASTSPTYRDSFGVDWYCWEGYFRLPRSAWSPSADRPGVSLMTEVRARDNVSGVLPTVSEKPCDAEWGTDYIRKGCTIPASANGGWVLRIAPSPAGPGPRI